jgi:hypothetical protein
MTFSGQHEYIFKTVIINNLIISIQFILRKAWIKNGYFHWFIVYPVLKFSSSNGSTFTSKMSCHISAVIMLINTLYTIYLTGQRNSFFMNCLKYYWVTCELEI